MRNVKIRVYQVLRNLFLLGGNYKKHARIKHLLILSSAVARLSAVGVGD